MQLYEASRRKTSNSYKAFEVHVDIHEVPRNCIPVMKQSESDTIVILIKKNLNVDHHLLFGHPSFSERNLNFGHPEYEFRSFSPDVHQQRKRKADHVRLAGAGRPAAAPALPPCRDARRR